MGVLHSPLVLWEDGDEEREKDRGVGVGVEARSSEKRWLGRL